MRLQELPPSESVAIASSKEELEAVLQRIFGEKLITHYDIIEGAPCSGRILCTEPSKTTVRIKGTEPGPMAEECMAFIYDARMAPQRAPSVKHKEAWEVRSATPLQSGPPKAILWATWTK